MGYGSTVSLHSQALERTKGKGRESYINPEPRCRSIRPNAGEGGGGVDSAPPCFTPERMVVERRGKRQTKALNKTNLRSTKNFA